MRPVHIVATGVRSPVGLRSASAAAAVRAGISRAREHPFLVDLGGEPMPAALDGVLDPRIVGPERFVMLSSSAMQEACEPLAAWPGISLPLYLGLPEPRPGLTESEGHWIAAMLSRQETLPISISRVQLYMQGHAAGLVALAHAKAAIDAGHESMCLVGGVESHFHPDTMEWLDANRRLSSARSRSGFVPGEAAGFCLLAGADACRNMRVAGLAAVLVVSLGHEPKILERDVLLGEGLTRTVRAAVQGLGAPGRRIDHIICDINGERHRGEEWGFVCLRLAQWFDDVASYQAPAASWGDVGAASGPLFIALACQASLRRYAKGPLTMVWTSSQGGTRAVLVLDDGSSSTG